MDLFQNTKRLFKINQVWLNYLQFFIELTAAEIPLRE